MDRKLPFQVRWAIVVALLMKGCTCGIQTEVRIIEENRYEAIAWRDTKKSLDTVRALSLLAQKTCGGPYEIIYVDESNRGCYGGARAEFRCKEPRP